MFNELMFSYTFYTMSAYSSGGRESTDNSHGAISDYISCHRKHTAGLSRQPLQTPNILVGPIWLDNEPPAVEIIELNSSNEELSPKELNRDGRRHAWSYVNNENIQNIENCYKINKPTREKRRFQNACHSTFPRTCTLTDSNNYNNDIPNSLYKHHSDTGEKFKLSHQVNRFNINNKHLVDSDSEASDGEYGDVEIITSGDILLGSNKWDQHNNNNFYEEEIITYDADSNQETRTIWIYSFKNKHLLADDDFEALPYKESSSSSYSTDSSGEQTKNTSCRVGSPTATYIPRLDLSLVPTLSTVVEISERNFEPAKSVQSTSRKIQTHANNWFVSESAKDGGRPIRKHEKSTSIINWMSLSPRERRRVLKDNAVSDTWVGSCLNLSEVGTDNDIIEDRGDQVNKYGQNVVEVQVDVEVHVDCNDANGDKAKTNSANSAVRANTDDISSINKIKYADAANDDFQKDRGDHDTKLIAPVIRVTPKHRKAYITDPIEKLENSNWIHEKEEKETSVYDYVLERSESILDVSNTVNAVDHLWMKNTIPFLKPSHWHKFKPIADSPRSCYISIGSIEERKTWFKRVMNFLKCCK